MNSEKGTTLIEIIASAAMLALLCLGAASVFSNSQRGFTLVEAKATLKRGTQKGVTALTSVLRQNKRMFTAADAAFTSRFAGVVPAAGTRVLPVIEPGGSLDSSSPLFQSGSVGNSLFTAFLSQTFTEDIPLGPGTFQPTIDIYSFLNCYLAADPAHSIANSTRLMLFFQISVPHADYEQIMSIPGGGSPNKRMKTVQALYGAGFRFAWNSSNHDRYSLEASGAMSPVGAATAIPVQETYDLFAQSRSQGRFAQVFGLQAFSSSLGGYRVGISPNGNAGYEPDEPVPLFSSLNPGGLEIAVVGSGNARKAMIRLVGVAQGTFKGWANSESLAVVSFRDVW
ncbi:MAG: hypothetical protein ACT4O3_10450 [Elusimicrobiota bacterium]